MASTFTKTATQTFARLEILKSQVRTVVNRTTDLSLETIKNTFDKGIDKRWINGIKIYALDSENRCCAQLFMEIDWDEHNLQLSQGKTTVSIDGKNWLNDTIFEVGEVIHVFNLYVSKNSLKTSCRVSYLSSLDEEEVMKQLNLTEGEEIKWKNGSRLPNANKIPELPEFSIGYYLVDD
jgi:hypothetical protein